MKAIIIEDSRLARNELKSLLLDFPVVKLIGEAVDGGTALGLIEQKQPDLIFLDIQLPGKNGFEILETLDQVPQVIFTTAFDEYAIRSFEYNAIDYLLKPIKKERLAKAIQKARDNKQKQANDNQLSAESRVFVKDGENCWFVTVGDIQLFESYGNYTRIFFGQHKPLILKSLNYLEEVLDPVLFFRINRKQMINLKAIENIVSWFNGRIKLRLQNGIEVEVSRRQTHKLKELFSF
jgi:two-component system LytT family response regulator